HKADNTLCPPGQFCVPASGGCTSGKPCNNDAQCQDGDLCNGVEACIMGSCHPGAPVDCEDLYACTIDTCDPATGACSHTPYDAVCDDGLVCNGVETCDVQLGCLPGVQVDCNDNVVCTIDTCNEPSGTCSHTLTDALCDDGKLCNVIETCTPQG